MHKLASAVRSILDSHTKCIPVEQRGPFVALCLARALSVDLPLPTSPVTSIQAFYGSTVYGRVAEFVAAFNENYVVDVKLVMDLVYKHYRLRYKLVFEPQAIIPLYVSGCLTDELVSGDLMKVFNECATDREGLINAFLLLIREMTAGCEETPETVIAKAVPAVVPA